MLATKKDDLKDLEKVDYSLMLVQISNVFHKHFPTKKSNKKIFFFLKFNLQVNLLKYYVFESNKFHQSVPMVMIESMNL
jgi:hypothetical protein